MGDVVHALPMATDIARAFPHARIDWVVEEAFADIPRINDVVTRVIPIALRRWRRRPFAPSTWRQFFAARKALRETRYHAIIDCQGLIKSALLACMARGPVTGFGTKTAREPAATLFYQRKESIDPQLHAVERMRRLGAAALAYPFTGTDDFGLHTRLAQLRADPPFQESGAVLLITNASRASKLWPDENWVALEYALAREGKLSLLPWGNAQENMACKHRVAQMQTARLLPRASLGQIASLVSRASLVVGLDTGLTQLAAAVGAPTVGIFCDYDTASVGLRGSERTVSLGGADKCPKVEDVLAAVRQVLAPSAESAVR